MSFYFFKDDIMQLKYQFVFQQVGPKYMGVAVGESAKRFSGMLQLNEMGHDIVSKMTGETTRDEIVDQLLKEYDSDRATLEGYVDKVVAYLDSEGVLDR